MTAAQSDRHRDIAQIKLSYPLLEVVERAGVHLKRAGSHRWQGLCPFHEDRTPSLTVYPASGTFHCFGCRATGDVISFVRAIEHLGFAQTLDALDQMASHNESQPPEDKAA